MSKLVGDPIKVHENIDALPAAFIWRRLLYHVDEVVGWWREPAEWWHDRALRFFVRVVARNSSSGTYELYRLGKQWFLHRVLD